MSLLAQLIGQEHQEKLLKKQYELESARNMIEKEADKPGIYSPAMIQLAAEKVGLTVPKDQQQHFHRALGEVLPHIFGRKKPERAPNGGAMSSAGSAAPQAAMSPPPTDPNTTTLNYGGMPSMPAPPIEPLPASGQVGSGSEAPSDTQAPKPALQITSPPSEGFSSLAPPPGPFLRNGPSVPFHVNSLEERVQANAPGVLAQAGVDAQVAAQKYAATKARLENEDWFKKLSPRQQAIVSTGATGLSPELRPANLPGMVHGSDIPDSTIDAFGNPVDKDAMYRVRLGAEGREYFPEVATTTTKTVPDDASPTKFSLVFLDRTGHEISRTVGATPPAGFVPQTSTTTSNVTKLVPDAKGQIHAIPVTNTGSTTRQRVLPGTTPTQSIPAPPGAAKAQPSPRATGGSPGRIVGQSPSMTRMLAENPLTTQAQAIVTQAEPKLTMLRRIKTELAKYKNDNTPGNMLLPRIAYALGMDAKDMGGFLSQLEVNNIGSAANLMRGTSRAGTILEKALIHTPNAWKDSGKLMYDKVGQIENALTDIIDVAKKEGQKYPGLNRGTEITPPPGAPRTAAEYLKSIGR